MKTLSASLVFVLAAGFSFLFYQCSHETSQQAAVQPPFENVDVPMNQFAFMANAGANVAMENGTRIIVPADAFVDAAGNLVKDEVQLNYREFHTAGDVIASGIPMSYDTGGSRFNFESAGMFEVNAMAAGAPVFVADGKSIEVQMASFQPGDDYSFYRLDDKSGQWNYVATATAQPNEAKQEKMEALPDPGIKPLQPQEADKNAPVIDLEVNYYRVPELKPFKGIMWQYAGTDPKLDPVKNPWLQGENWYRTSMEPVEGQSGIFKLEMKSRNRTFTTLVKPVLSGKNYRQALADFNNRMEDYNKIIADRKAEEERLAREADLVRSFQVQNMGIYNWDRIYKQPNVVRVPANFEFDQPVDAKNVSIFLVSGEERAVVKYSSSDAALFCYDPEIDNKLVAVLPGDKIAVFTSEQFQKLNAQQLATKEQYTFRLKTQDRTISSPKELDRILVSL